MQPPVQDNFILKHKTAIIVVTAIISFVVLAYSIPMLVGNGTERFTGVKREIAVKSLQYLYDVSDSIQRAANIASGYHDYIEDVIEFTPEEARENCKLSADEDATGYYSVYSSQVKSFGFRSESEPQTALATCDISRKVKFHQ